MKKEIDFDLLASLNKAFIEYYAKADKFKIEENFLVWLDDLSLKHPDLRTDFEKSGFEESKNTIAFMRFILELNGIGLFEHMKKSLSENDYYRFTHPDDWVIPKEMNIVNTKTMNSLI